MFSPRYKVFASGAVIETFTETGEEVVINHFIGSFEGFPVCATEASMNPKTKDFPILSGISLPKTKSKIRTCQKYNNENRKLKTE